MTESKISDLCDRIYDDKKGAGKVIKKSSLGGTQRRPSKKSLKKRHRTKKEKKKHSETESDEEEKEGGAVSGKPTPVLKGHKKVWLFKLTGPKKLG